MNIDLICDLQFGSTGKGLIAGYLAENWRYDTVISANMPNAGHTYVDSRGNKMIHHVLPNGIVGLRGGNVLLGPGSVLSPARLNAEMEHAESLGYDEFLVNIHPNAVALTEGHVRIEEEMVGANGSTVQGSCAAQVHKMWRSTSGTNAVWGELTHKDLRAMGMHPRVRVVDHDYWENVLLRHSHRVLAEGSQGFSLGINQRFYPYSTSRECSPYRILSEMGVPFGANVNVIGTLRTYPIRVAGNSGGWYPDQEETTFEAIGQEQETTTTTGRPRRIATFSKRQVQEAAYWCKPKALFLNFCNYMSPDRVDALIDYLQGAVAPVSWTGHGPSYDDVSRGPGCPGA